MNEFYHHIHEVWFITMCVFCLYAYLFLSSWIKLSVPPVPLIIIKRNLLIGKQTGGGILIIFMIITAAELF